jgi:PAS domain S-box-containing protein
MSPQDISLIVLSLLGLAGMLVTLLDKTTYWKRYLPTILTICIGAGISLTAFAFIDNWEQANLEKEFDRAAENYRSVINKAFDNCWLTLEAIRNLYNSEHQNKKDEQIERDEFKTFVQSFFSRLPSIQALEWVPCVSGIQRENYEIAAQQDGLKDFRIIEKTPQGNLIPASKRNEYYPIYYVEPYKGNEIALGFDLGSEPARLEAIRKARDTGKAAATEKITLVQEKENQPGLLVFLPIYKNGTDLSTVEQRRRNLQGFALLSLRVNDFIKTAMAQLQPQNIDIHIKDASAPPGRQFLYSRLSNPQQLCDRAVLEKYDVQKPEKDMSKTIFVKVGGRDWSLRFVATPAFVERYQTRYCWIALVTGFIFTGLLTVYLLISINRTARIERLVDERTSQLQKSEEKFRRTLESATDCISVWDMSYNCLYANEAAVKYIEATKDKTIGKNIREILNYIPDLLELGLRHLDEAVKTGESVYSENSIAIKDKQVYSESSASPLRDAKGNTFAIAVVYRDITERKWTETAMESLNKELKATVEKLIRSNCELKEFAHITAHDLKAPARAIAILAGWLATDYSDKFDERGKKQIDLLVGRAKRMGNLIDSLLRYNELEWKKLPTEEVDLNELLSEVINKIQPPANIRITCENALPALICEKEYLTEVFLNLIGNAVRYIDKPRGRIKISCSGEGNFWKFSISDNGSGIDKKYFEKIFKIFQTLSPRDEVEVTGISLPIARKIVEMYGGEIWVESEIGKGSTFLFTLPKQKAVTENAKSKANIAC